MNIHKPVILYEGKNTQSELEKLERTEKIWKTRDIYKEQLIELFEINHPKIDKTSKEYKKKLQSFIKRRTIPSKKLKGNWIYFPWSGDLIHTVNGKEYLQLRTNRNRNLITTQEQKKLYNSCIGVIGLSVGSGIAVGLAYQEIAKNMKLTEFDVLETTNLNRVRAGIHQIGMSKTDIVVQQIYEINPYQNLILYPDGLKKEKLKEFIHKSPKPKVIFEIVDDFEMKIRVRMEARRAGIPVIGPANLGDRILWDIERYDLNKKLPLLNGVLGKLPEKILENPDEDKNKYAVAMVERKNIPKRAIDSVGQIGKTLVGRPQLSSTVTISGAIGVYIARKIVLGKPLTSGRYLVDLERLFKKRK